MFKLKNSSQRSKKKPPPRPPPPDLSKIRSKSTVNLVQHLTDHNDLIDLSPSNSPKVDSRRPFGGSVSSSFSSSTSSIASSKKSYDYESPTFNSNCWGTGNSTPAQSNNYSSVHNSFRTTNYTSTANYTSTSGSSVTCNSVKTNSNNTNYTSNNSIVPSLFGPTIIRAAPPKINYRQKAAKADDLSHSPTPPMPTVPPPSPPKDNADVITPYGVALYDFQATHPSDLSLQVDDVVILQRRVNEEWLYGQVGEKEGMFPSSFIDVVVPLAGAGEDKVVTALYEFTPQLAGDLALVPGQKVNVIKKMSNEWLYGESNGNLGQFPVTFVNRIPKFLQC